MTFTDDIFWFFHSLNVVILMFLSRLGVQAEVGQMTADQQPDQNPG